MCIAPILCFIWCLKLLALVDLESNSRNPDCLLLQMDIPLKWKQLWDIWDLRGFIILSLSLQTFLILFAPLRKRTKSNWIIMPLWFVYLLADWVANFAIGLILNSQGNAGGNSSKKGDGVRDVENEDLLAFWAPFLLVHLGGPDTITAFALEDNELWLRHLLGLVFQCLATVYVFVRSLPQNRLWIPTILMFMTGIIKYTERTRALYLASAGTFANRGPNYWKFFTDFRVKYLYLPNRREERNLTELEVLDCGYRLFEVSKGLVIDKTSTRTERDFCNEFFLFRTAKDAFKVVEVELNFMYEVLFTKLPVVYGYFGAVSRMFSMVTVVSAIILFISKNKSNFSSVDVTITYVLLFGALALDITALLMLVFSDWTIISLWKWLDFEPDNKSLRTRILSVFLILKTGGMLQDPKDNAQVTTNEPQPRRWPIRVLKRRWSESISTYNLIYYCLHPSSRFEQFVFENLGLSGFLDGIKYVKPKKFTVKLRNFIFKELRLKLRCIKDVETGGKIGSSQGDWVLGLLGVEECWSDLLPHVQKVDYGQTLLVWHIATELCYNKELNDKLKSTTPTNANRECREIAKLLSDYMLYLLIIQPNMTKAVTGPEQTTFQDTCGHAINFFKRTGKGRELNKEQKQSQGWRDTGVDWEQINACMDILEKEDLLRMTGAQKLSSPELRTFQHVYRASLLLDGYNLAKDIMAIEERGDEDKWLMISKVWVELLCYAAKHVPAKALAAQVSKGGELVTIVWLLMAHFGLGEMNLYLV